MKESRINLGFTFKSFISDLKGQGAMEYLLIIGGAILIAAVVISILASSGSKAKTDIVDSESSYDNAKSELENEIIDN